MSIIGQPAPELDVTQWLNAPGGLGLADMRGRVVALHAFQMLCPGCVAHGIPQAQRIRAEFEPRDVAVVGLHTVFEHHDAMGPAALAAFVHEYRVDFPIGVDRRVEARDVPETMRAYRMRGTPTLVLIDRDGIVRESYFGRPTDMRVGASIARLVEREAEERCSEDGCAIAAP